MSKSRVTEIRNALSGMYPGTLSKYNANSIGIGLREKNGQVTNELCVVFGVNKKKDTLALKETEIIPRDLTRFGINARTDVVECSEVQLLENHLSFENQIQNTIETLEGGGEIIQGFQNEISLDSEQEHFGMYNLPNDLSPVDLNFDTLNNYYTNADSLVVDYFHEPEHDDPVVGLHRKQSRPLSGGISSIYSKSGGTATLGMLVKDSTDKQPVLLSNNHVYAASQFVGIEGNVFSSYSNTFLMSARQPGFGDVRTGVYQNTGSPAPNATMERDHIGFAKRCVPLRTDGDNYVDAAIMSVSGLHNIQDDPVNNPTHGYGSNNILHLAQQGPYEFATEAEIDGLIDPDSEHFLSPVFRSGRTLGPIGFPGSTESKTINREINFDYNYSFLSGNDTTDFHAQGEDRIAKVKFNNHVQGNFLQAIQPGFGDSIHIHSDANDVFVGGFQKAADYWYRFTSERDIALYPGAVDWKNQGSYTQIPGKFYGPDDSTRIAIGNSNTYGVSGTGGDQSSGTLSGSLVYYGGGSFSDRMIFFVRSAAKDYLPGLVPSLSSTQGQSEYQKWPVQPNLIVPACTATRVAGLGLVGEFTTGGHTHGLPLIHVRAQTWNAGGGSPTNPIPSTIRNDNLNATSPGTNVGGYEVSSTVQPTWGNTSIGSLNDTSKVQYVNGGVYPPWVVHKIDQALSGDYFKASDNMYVKTPSAGNITGMDIKNQPFFYRYDPSSKSERTVDIAGDASGRLIRANFRSGWTLFMHTPIDRPDDDEPTAASSTGGAYRSSNRRLGLNTSNPILVTSGVYAFNPNFIGTKSYEAYPIYLNPDAVGTGTNKDGPTSIDILQGVVKSDGTPNPDGPWNHEFVPLSSGGNGFICDISVHKNRSTAEGPAVDRMDPRQVKVLNGNYHDAVLGVSSILSGNKIYSIGTNHLFSTIMDGTEKDAVHRVWTPVEGSYKEAHSYGFGAILALNESTHKVHFSSTHSASGATNATNHMSSRVDNAYDLYNNNIDYLGTYRKLFIEGESFSWFIGQQMDDSIRFVFARGGWDPVAYAKIEKGSQYFTLSTFNQNTECFSSFRHGFNHLFNENGTVWYSTVIGMAEKNINQAIGSTHSMFFKPLTEIQGTGTGWFQCKKLHDDIDSIDGHAHTINFAERKTYGRDCVAFLSGGNWYKSGKNLDNFMATTSAYKDEVIVTAAGINVNVNFGAGRIITFRDCLAIRSKHKHFPVTQGGDSGSAVLALFNGDNPDPGHPDYNASIHTSLSGWKVIGLVYAGPRPTNSAPGIVCRIDRIVDQLQIEPWDGVIPTDTIRNRNVIEVTDLQTPMTMTLSGRKFYNVGGGVPDVAPTTVIS